MELDVLQVFLGLVMAVGCGFLAAWLLRGQSLDRAATYAASLEQLLAGTMRDRDSALERERNRTNEARLAQQAQAQRIVELEAELEHREMQVITFREEAIQLARAREEVSQRLAWQEQTSQEVESSMAARIRELQELHGEATSSIRAAGTRITGAERELAALVAAHETDLAQLEARFLDLIRSKDEEIERLKEAGFSPAPSPAPAPEPVAGPPAPSETLAVQAEAPAPVQSYGNGGEVATRPRSRRKRRMSRDDLKRIHGIDESVEQALHLVGVTSFRQLARWKDKDIDRMARRLYQPPERIRNERWVENAREEYARKYGGPP